MHLVLKVVDVKGLYYIPHSPPPIPPIPHILCPVVLPVSITISIMFCWLPLLLATLCLLQGLGWSFEYIFCLVLGHLLCFVCLLLIVLQCSFLVLLFLIVLLLLRILMILYPRCLFLSFIIIKEYTSSIINFVLFLLLGDKSSLYSGL